MYAKYHSDHIFAMLSLNTGSPRHGPAVSKTWSFLHSGGCGYTNSTHITMKTQPVWVAWLAG